MATNQKRTETKQRQKKSNNWLPVAAAAVLVIAVVGTLLPNNNGGSESSTTSAAETSQVISEGESLVIPVSEVSTTAQFYPVTVDGTAMEIIAVKDSSGYIRTAYNTCQVCYSSGKGYYVQDGNDLVCQNCRNRFTVDQVEIQSGGCNPWPIFQEDKIVTEEAVSISYDSLKAATQIFANWKR